MSDKAEHLEILRHDCAHIMAMAVQELFPETQVSIGPPIENGFYYDFARDKPFTLDDLEVIEAKMKEIVKQDLEITYKVFSRKDAIKFFEDINKIEIKNELKQLTSEAFAKDIFGAPTFVVNKKIFWGQDRLDYAIDELNS